MNALIYRRDLDSGRSSEGRDEIYLPHVREMSAALARANTAEAAQRKLSIKTLWRCAGRSGEPGKILYTGLSWNLLFDCLVAEAPQVKTSKSKWVPFIAGVDRHTDWVLDFGDDLAWQRGSMNYNSEEPLLLIPELKGEASGTKLGNYVKALQPEGRPGRCVHSHCPYTAHTLATALTDLVFAALPATDVCHFAPAPQRGQV